MMTLLSAAMILGLLGVAHGGLSLMCVFFSILWPNTLWKQVSRSLMFATIGFIVMSLTSSLLAVVVATLSQTPK